MSEHAQAKESETAFISNTDPMFGQDLLIASSIGQPGLSEQGVSPAQTLNRYNDILNKLIEKQGILVQKLQDEVNSKRMDSSPGEQLNGAYFFYLGMLDSVLAASQVLKILRDVKEGALTAPRALKDLKSIPSVTDEVLSTLRHLENAECSR